MNRERLVNNLIKKENLDTNLISDGYHTFSELYEFRHALYIALAKRIQSTSLIPVWRFKTDEDWFILGIDKLEGSQISFHLPMSKWKDTEFAYTSSIRPTWDKHTSNDVLERLKQL